MVENSVQNHPKTKAVGGFYQFPQILFSSEGRVNPVIVINVVFMRRVSLKNRSQVDNVRPKVPDIG